MFETLKDEKNKENFFVRSLRTIRGEHLKPELEGPEVKNKIVVYFRKLIPLYEGKINIQKQEYFSKKLGRLSYLYFKEFKEVLLEEKLLYFIFELLRNSPSKQILCCTLVITANFIFQSEEIIPILLDNNIYQLLLPFLESEDAEIVCNTSDIFINSMDFSVNFVKIFIEKGVMSLIQLMLRIEETSNFLNFQYICKIYTHLFSKFSALSSFTNDLNKTREVFGQLLTEEPLMIMYDRNFFEEFLIAVKHILKIDDIYFCQRFYSTDYPNNVKEIFKLLSEFPQKGSNKDETNKEKLICLYDLTKLIKHFPSKNEYSGTSKSFISERKDKTLLTILINLINMKPISEDEEDNFENDGLILQIEIQAINVLIEFVKKRGGRAVTFLSSKLVYSDFLDNGDNFPYKKKTVLTTLCLASFVSCSVEQFKAFAGVSLLGYTLENVDPLLKRHNELLKEMIQIACNNERMYCFIQNIESLERIQNDICLSEAHLEIKDNLVRMIDYLQILQKENEENEEDAADNSQW